MIIEQLIQQLHSLRLRGMAASLAQQEQAREHETLRFEERLHLMIQSEIAARDSDSLAQRLHWAKIPNTVRTNQAAIDYLTTLLRQYHYTVVAVPVSGCLHLKTAVTYVGRNTILINPDWVPRDAFAKHPQIDVDSSEPMGANALHVGSHLLM